MKTSLFSCTALAVAWAIAGPTLAQTANKTGAVALDDVIVTAQRRAESLQSVPINVVAIEAKEVAAQGATGTRDLSSLVPGLQFPKVTIGGTPAIRGVVHGVGSLGDEPPVAVYVDGVYMPNTISTLFSFNNIARIEVLKGPQGTLFGRNATGGVIQIVSKQPSTTPSVDAEIGYGNYNTVEGNFYGTAGLSNSLAADLAIYARDQSKGWGYNPYLQREIFKSEDEGVRSSWRWAPSDKLTVSVAGVWSHSEGNTGANSGVAPGALGNDRITRYISRYDIASASDGFNKSTVWNLSNHIEYDLGWTRLVNIIAHHDVDGFYQLNQNGSVGSNLCATCANAVQNIPQQGKTNTEELQLQSPTDSKVNWIVGGFFMDDKVGLQQYIFAQFNTAAPRAAIAVVKLKSYSAFAQATWPVGDSTRLTTGIRYTTDRRNFSGTSYPLPGYPNSVTVLPASIPTSVPPNLQSHEWSKATWRLSLDHNFTDKVMGYASYNRGFKSGVYNATALNQPPVNPEVIDAFEVGLKSQLFEDRLRLNGSVFYYNYKDIQLRAAAIQQGVVTLLNAAQSRMKGASLDFVALLSDRITVSGGVEYLDAKYDSFPGAQFSRVNPLGGNTTYSADASGYDMIIAPDWTATLSGQYRQPTSVGEIAYNVKYHYNDTFNFTVDGRRKQPVYNLVDASIVWSSPTKQWDFRVWGRNLLNAFYFANAGAGASDTYTPEAPRTFGVTLGYHWGQ